MTAIQEKHAKLAEEHSSYSDHRESFLEGGKQMLSLMQDEIEKARLMGRIERHKFLREERFLTAYGENKVSWMLSADEGQLSALLAKVGC